ncbi:MAG: aminopeptidase [Alistipes sp.]|uniref:aminopeptidase C n=1 Tax=Alistipes sp. TaxID=1872444 RepID=UPI001B6BA527|nr:aminopeptidase [Alistipes sp.]
MKKIFGLALGLILATGAMAQEAETPEYTFTVVKENPITSIKNQNQAGTCWCYSSLAFIESELLRMGKGEYDFSEMFIVHNTYLDRADKAVRTHGDVSFSQGGSFYDVIYGMEAFGLVPEAEMRPGVMYGKELSVHNELSAVSDAIVAAIAEGRHRSLQVSPEGEPLWKKAIEAVHDIYLGVRPETFTYEGKEYTPHSFYESLGLNAADYVSLTSYTHHPFYKPFVLEIQDNWRWAQSYNLPIDELMEVFDNAIMEGYTIAWGSDVSEKGFTRQGMAVLPLEATGNDLQGSDMARWLNLSEEERKNNPMPAAELWCTQEQRQIAYDNWETTDDHGMLIYGIAKDQNGTEYYIVKNSWGEAGTYKGIWYASKAFVRYKTMNIIVHKNAIPKDIRKKLGL